MAPPRKTLERFRKLKKDILNVDIPEAQERGADPDQLRLCKNRVIFIAASNPLQYEKGSCDRKLAFGLFLKGIHKLEQIRQEVDFAVAAYLAQDHLNPFPEPGEKPGLAEGEQDELDRFLFISHDKKLCIADSEGKTALGDRVLRRSGVMAAMDTLGGFQPGYHLKMVIDMNKARDQDIRRTFHMGKTVSCVFRTTLLCRTDWSHRLPLKALS